MAYSYYHNEDGWAGNDGTIKIDSYLGTNNGEISSSEMVIQHNFPSGKVIMDLFTVQMILETKYDGETYNLMILFQYTAADGGAISYSVGIKRLGCSNPEGCTYQIGLAGAALFSSADDITAFGSYRIVMDYEKKTIACYYNTTTNKYLSPRDWSLPVVTDEILKAAMPELIKQDWFLVGIGYRDMSKAIDPPDCNTGYFGDACNAGTFSKIATGTPDFVDCALAPSSGCIDTLSNVCQYVQSDPEICSCAVSSFSPSFNPMCYDEKCSKSKAAQAYLTGDQRGDKCTGFTCSLLPKFNKYQMEDIKKSTCDECDDYRYDGGCIYSGGTDPGCPGGSGDCDSGDKKDSNDAPKKYWWIIAIVIIVSVIILLVTRKKRPISPYYQYEMSN